MNIPAGRRSAEKLYITFDYENVPVAKEAEFTFTIVDADTWDTVETLDPVTIPMKD